MAVRGGTAPPRPDGQDRRAAGLRPVRVWIWTFLTAAYGHVRRGGADDDGADGVPRFDARRGSDPTPLLLRRHGWFSEGPGQRSQSGDDAAASGQAVDPGS